MTLVEHFCYPFRGDKAVEREYDMALSSQDEVRTFYAAAADSYNAMMDQEIQLPLYDTVLRELAEKLQGVAGAILDSSCGTGHMLERIKTSYAIDRALIGVDLSPRMVQIAQTRLGDSVTVFESDMGALAPISDGSCAAVISFFALHHVDLAAFARCLAEWHRVLEAGGHLLLATWEGAGAIDYGGTADMVTRRYREAEVIEVVAAANFDVTSHSVEPVEGMVMDAVYLFAAKIK